MIEWARDGKDKTGEERREGEEKGEEGCRKVTKGRGDSKGMDGR